MKTISKKINKYILYIIFVTPFNLSAQSIIDSTRVYNINEVVVTGSRSETDVRHLSQTVSVVGRDRIER